MKGDRRRVSPRGMLITFRNGRDRPPIKTRLSNLTGESVARVISGSASFLVSARHSPRSGRFAFIVSLDPLDYLITLHYDSIGAIESDSTLFRHGCDTPARSREPLCRQSCSGCHFQTLLYRILPRCVEIWQRSFVTTFHCPTLIFDSKMQDLQTDIVSVIF